MNSSDVKIVLLGKTGSGKSSTGNTILGRECFEQCVSPESVTSKCRQCDGKRGGKCFSVIDTPGIFNTTMSEEELKTEVEKCVGMCVPGPCVFLIVISLTQRFTEEDRKAVMWFLDNFGEYFYLFSIIVFTHPDLLKGKTVDCYIKESIEVRRIINNCGDRFHVLNNKSSVSSSQVTELLKKILGLVERNGNRHYGRELYNQAQINLQELEEKRKKEIEENSGFAGYLRRVMENPVQFLEERAVSALRRAGLGTVGVVIGGLVFTGTVGYTLLLAALVSCAVKVYLHKRRQ